MDSCHYVMNIVHDLRLRLESHTKLQTNSEPKGIKTQSASTPTHATIFVALTYTSWKLFAINQLKQLYLSNNHSLPDNHQLVKHFKHRSEIDDFLEETGDISSLDRQLSFDEYEILQINQDYLRRILNVEEIDICFIDNHESDGTMLVNLEDNVPDKPTVHFHHEKSVIIRLINRQPYSLNFEWSIPVMNGDTMEKLEIRFRRHADRQLQLTKNIRLFYFHNSELYTRTLPNITTLLQVLAEFENKQQVLKIDIQNDSLILEEQNIGDILVYFVE